VSGLFSCRRFADFGPSRFLPPPGAPALDRVRARRSARLRQRVRDKAPRRPGVYGMLDPGGTLVYVGKAKCLRTRLLSYFRSSSDPKAGRILDHTRTLVWETAPSEFAALLRELELIRRFRPRFNVAGIPGRQRVTYVCLGRAPASQAFVARQPNGKELACFGPLPGSQYVGAAVRWVNDYFRLRDCPRTVKMHFAEQGELFPVLRPACLRYEIGTCSGPCARHVTRGDYSAQVRAARRFFDGSDTALVDRLAGEMKEAARSQAFERAADLRDRHRALSWLTERLAWLRSTRQHSSFVYPLAGGDGTDLWYLIHRGRVWGVVPWPRDAATRRLAAERIEAVYELADGARGALPADEIDSILLVAGWFKKHDEERGKLLRPTEALTGCRESVPA
jgi:excinuclease ABC subunit C